jgi:hypothetical protein
MPLGDAPAVMPALNSVTTCALAPPGALMLAASAATASSERRVLLTVLESASAFERWTVGKRQPDHIDRHEVRYM